MQGPQSALLRSKLESCNASKPYAVSSLFVSQQEWDDVYDDAKAFLDQRDRVARLAPENGRLMSDLIQLDIERFSKMANLQARCIDCAEEQGTDPKLCESLSRDLDYASQ